ncbi:POK18 protein, partial [Alectura lathami]|nr:POK18 protein [Alectura lathami]
VQKLVGSINWIRPYLGITNTQLAPLLELLQGSENPTDKRSFSDAAKQVIETVETALKSKSVARIDLTVCVQLFILKDHEVPYGILCQWNDNWEDKLHIL